MGREGWRAWADVLRHEPLHRQEREVELGQVNYHNKWHSQLGIRQTYLRALHVAKVVLPMLLDDSQFPAVREGMT